MWENVIHAYSDPTLLNENLLYVIKREKIPHIPPVVGRGILQYFSTMACP